MEIWIRGQSKETLTNVSNLYVNGPGTWILTAKKDENITVPLGKYENKERGIQVLDEIQDYIRSCNYTHSHICMYEMPQE